MQDFLDCLVARGAAANGRGFVHNPSDSLRAFSSPTDFVSEEIEVSQLTGLTRARRRERLVAVEVANALSYDAMHSARLTFLALDPRHVGIDKHPVALWGSGEVFSHPRGDSPPSEYAVGADVRELFIALVNCITPDYAAVTVEQSLRSPSGMALDSESAASDYRNVYLGRQYVGDDSLERLAAAATGLNVERVCDGLCVFTDSAFGGPQRYSTGATHASRRFVRAIIDRSDAAGRLSP